MIKDFTPRLYQETILGTAATKNTLVVLPTGMGKTNVFLMLTSHRLEMFPNSKILLLGPTKPLIEQYHSVFLKHLEIEPEKLAIFTGLVSPEKRGELWKTAQIIFSTPQGLENDIISGRIDLREVSLLGFDEAHRAVGDYAYVFVAKQYMKFARFPRIIAMTASPGSDLEKIKEVSNNLFIEAIESRSGEEADVKPYIKDTTTEWIEVNLTPQMLKIKQFLEKFTIDRMEKLKQWGILQRKELRTVNKTDLLALQAQLRGRAGSGEKDFVIWNGISVLAELMKISHASELLETQGVKALHQYLVKLNEEGQSGKTKAVKNIVRDADYRSALYLSEQLYNEGTQHPKLVELLHIVDKEIKKNPDLKMLIFNQYRDNALNVQQEIEKIPGVRSQLFVGQMKKGETGLSQKEQKEMLDKFRSGEYNILVATSIGEEGLDIPRVDIVLFYEPIPSAIRHIQRRGRTGRQEEGRVIILVTKNTRDEGYKWSAHHKEKRMHKTIQGLQKTMTLEKKEVELTDFTTEKPLIYADHREKASGVIKELLNLGTEIRLEQLQVADYILSGRVGVEFKTVEDFVNSLVDGRLMSQIKELRENFSRPIVLIEGEHDIYTVRNVHPNAIRGMISTIIVSYGVPLIQTKNAKESAALLRVIAKREQEETTREFQPHGSKKPMSMKESSEYIVSAFPGVGINLARPLLKEFGSVKKVVNATLDELQKVEKIGPNKAKQIRDVLDYED